MYDRCCARCFNDNGLTNNIFPNLAATTGTCPICKADNQQIVWSRHLSDYFELLLASYEESETGKPLANCLLEDWKIFESISSADAALLLAEILDDGNIARRKYIPKWNGNFKPVANWETLKTEIKHKNRYFLDEALNQERLADLLPYLVPNELQEDWHRARIMTNDEVFDLANMGAPPKKIASHGRANPSGIPYLYLASKPETALAEIRPHTGDKASVAQFHLDFGRNIVDLRDPRRTASPFILADSVQISKLRADLLFLEKLGEELTRPVLPRSAAIDYVPSQFLCEFIKKQGFIGVIYGSSMSDGSNLALFDTTKAKPMSVKVYEISAVKVDVRETVQFAPN